AHWVALDFAEVTDFAELKIWPQNYAGGGSRAPKNFVVQGSNNGSSWSTIASFNDVTDWIAGTPKIFNLLSSEIT
ncbi:discoidin domain-containing protein, partial [Acinetobacter bouvetii]|uniref:discoidin domain-containing protein n=1 Tax=Acinetobacter bouvetii TaxID=202951 RepID=UPI0013EE75B6